MKTTLLITAAGSLLMIAGCSQQSQIESAINKNLKANSLCLNISSTVFPPYGMDSLLLQKMKRDNAAVVVTPMTNGQAGVTDSYSELNSSRLEALVKAGLLVKTVKNLPAIDPTSQKPIANTTFAVSLYNLTDAGKNTIQDIPASNQTLPGEKTQNILCYAQPQIESVISTTQYTIEGHKEVDVSYKFKYTNIADWINKPEIESSFPEIGDQLKTRTNTTTTRLADTKDGWVIVATPRYN